MKRLTDRQISILRFIARQIRDRGYAPTVRETMAEFGFRSTFAVNCHFAGLQRKGMLTDYDPSNYAPRGSRSRSIRLTPAGRFWCRDIDTWLGRLPSSGARIVPVNTGARCPNCRAQTFAPDKPCPMCRRHLPECSVSRVSSSVSAADRVTDRAVGFACS